MEARLVSGRFLPSVRTWKPERREHSRQTGSPCSYTKRGGAFVFYFLFSRFLLLFTFRLVSFCGHTPAGQGVILWGCLRRDVAFYVFIIIIISLNFVSPEFIGRGGLYSDRVSLVLFPLTCPFQMAPIFFSSQFLYFFYFAHTKCRVWSFEMCHLCVCLHASAKWGLCTLKRV